MSRYRAPTVFLQFQSDVITNVEPTQIVSVTTMKTLANPAGMFELTLKTSTELDDRKHGPRGTVNEPNNVDAWFGRVKPMTLCIIAMGSPEDVGVARRILTAEGNQSRSPQDLMSSLADRDRPAFLRSVVMVGLVDEVTLSTAMSERGPQRLLTVTGRDLGKLLLDDTIRRMVRGTDEFGIDHRLITVGQVSPDLRARLINRVTLQTTDRYWEPTTKGGMSHKQPLWEVLSSTLYRAPGIQTALKNGNAVVDYFSRLDVSQELMSYYVRGLMTMFWFNGPLWEALKQLVPTPLGELFVDTVGLQNVLIARRPPFLRPATMQQYRKSVSDFLQVTGYESSVSDQVLAVQALDEDQFTTVPSRVISAPFHTIPAEDVVVSSFGRSGVAAMAQYQVVPTVLMQGEMSEMPISSGVVGAYIYDLACAARFGTRVLQAACPWDLETGPEEVPAPEAISSENFSATALAGTVSTPERAVAGAETVRLYYLFRDSAEFISGSVTIRARPEVRVGDRILLPGFGNLIAYVESVQHSYRFGVAFITQISFSRGQPVAPTGRLATYDAEDPVIQVGAVGPRQGVDTNGIPLKSPTETPEPPKVYNLRDYLGSGVRK